MRNFNLLKSFVIFYVILFSNQTFSNPFKIIDSYNKELSGFFAPTTITSFTPTSGVSGTVVTITGTGFTEASILAIGTTAIAVEFVNSTELKVIIPCGLQSGNLTIDGISAGLFTYISPTITTNLKDVFYCVGLTVPQIDLVGIPLFTIFNWENSNPSIGLATSGTGVSNIPTFTAKNTSSEPITSSVTVTPSINGCLGQSKNYTITVNPKPVAMSVSTISVCDGTPISETLLTAISPNSGTGTSFAWSGTNNAAIGLNYPSGISSPIPSFIASNSTNSLVSSKITVTPTFEGCIGNPLDFTINVDPQSKGGVLSGTASICLGQNSGLLSVSGATGAIQRWEQSIDNGANWTSITNTSSSFTSGALFITTQYRVVVQKSSCPIAYSNIATITVNSVPATIGNLTADAGNDAQICQGNTYSISSAKATNYEGLQWTTNGDGSFTGSTTLTPIYTPGPIDTSNGSVRLTLVATNNYPCYPNAIDEMTLSIIQIPSIVVINPTVKLCVEDPSYVITGVIPANYDNLLWESSGSGTFSPNNASVAPTYFPSTSDATLGTVTLKLTASRSPTNCNSSTFNTITLDFINKPTADAGPLSATICEGSFYVTNGAAATNYSNVTWSTSGSGKFINATTLLATYTPSVADYNLGFVDLTLSVNPLSPCAGTATDVIRLNLQKLPVISLRANDVVCISQNTYAIGGTSVTDYMANSEVWSSSGTGTFSPSGDPLNPSYNPSSDDLAAGFVTLKLTVNSVAPCTIPVSNSFVLSFQKLVVANAGPALTECDTPFHVTTATATLSTIGSLKWSTSGTGTFDSTNVLDPIYTPSAQDILHSPITLTLTANAKAPCTESSVSSVSVNLVKSPVITTTNQLPICEDVTSITVLGTTVVNQSGIIWTSATGTIISNNTILNPIVTPSAQDIINNQIVLTITAQPVVPCGVPVSKTVIIPIQKKPMVNAGVSQTICQGNSLITSDALSKNVTNLHWDNNGGDGTFTVSNFNTITEYSPGANEIASGQITLTLTGNAIAPCSGSVSSTISHTIAKSPVVTINPTEVSICETQTSYTVPASFVTLVNPLSVLSYQWTTPNMSRLTGANTWTPTYTPTAADIAAGFVNLTLTVNPKGPCATPSINTFKVTINKQATIAIVNDGFFCENTSKLLSATFTNHDPSSIYWTIVSGSGTITNANSTNPTFVPASDSGTVVLKISANSLTPCANTVSQNFTITVVKKPFITMTTIVDTVCSSQLTYNLTGNSVLDPTNTLQWTRVNPVGTGTFSTASILNPIYTFNAADIANGFVILRLTATSNSNCGLTDYKEIRINITKAPTIFTSSTNAVCQGSVFTASATAQDQAAILWSTIGSSNGLFTNANQLATQYAQGTNDSSSFSIQVTATGNAPCLAVSATKTVTVQQKPILDAGVENRSYCSGQPFPITGVSGQNLGTILWTSNSGFAGTFSNPSALNPSYTPSAAELAAGNPIVLTVTAQALTPCSDPVSDFIVLNLTPNQVVEAGNYPSICEGAPISLVGSATNTSGVHWTSSGMGTFSAVNSLTTNYTPSNSDIINGTVMLTLNARSDTNCPEVTDSTLITIVKKPTISVSDVQMCMDTPQITLTNASAANYQSLNWGVLSGAGSIPNPSIPTFISGVSGVSTVQSSVIRMTATPNSACATTATIYKDFIIQIQPSPTVEAGLNGAVCYISGQPIVPFTINGTSVTNASSLNWTSSGPGVFTAGTPVVFQSLSNSCASDILTLTAKGIGACSANTISDSVTLKINCPILSSETITSNTPTTICQNTTATYSIPVNSSVQSYTWSVPTGATIQSGQGTDAIQVVYSSGALSGNVAVTRTNGCGSAISTLPITINALPAETSITGTSAVCAGATNIIYTASPLSNATGYIWTLPNGSTVSTTTNTIALSFGLTDVSGNLSVIGKNSCGLGNASSAFPITINPPASLSSSLSPNAICSGTVFNYVPTSGTSGTKFTWTRLAQSGISNLATLGTGAINEILINTTANTVSVLYQVTTTTDQGCDHLQTVLVTVNPAPSLSAIDYPNAICSGSVFNYLPTSATGTVTWTRNSVTGISESASNGSGLINEVLTNTTSLPVSATYLLAIPANSFGCTNTTTKIDLVVHPLPQVSVNSASICSGSSATIKATPSISGTYSYVWTVPATANNPGNVASFTATVAGTYSVVITNTATNCASSSASGTVIVTTNASVTLVSGNASPTICIGSSLATPIQYAILPTTASLQVSGTLPKGMTFNSTSGILSGTPSQSGQFPYSVTALGCGNVLSGVITVNPVQSISYLSGNTNQVACQYAPIDPINFVLSSGVNAVTVAPAFPAGISQILNNGILTISGTPTTPTSLAQNYILTTQGTCGLQAIYSVTLDVRPEAILTFSTNSGAINQAVCQSDAIVPIYFSIAGGATGIIAPTLPSGLTLTQDVLTGIYTIQGNPLVNGIFNFPITTEGCAKTVFITISNVNSSIGIALSSPIRTDNQTLCQTNFNSPIQPIIYNVIGASNVTVNGLPTGISAVFSPTTGQLIISGTSTQSGIFNYTITSLPCSILKGGVLRISTPISVSNEVVTPIFCSSSNDGSIATTIVGGVSSNGLYAIHWSGPNGFQQNQTTITGLEAGQYTISGTDAIGCAIPPVRYTILPAEPINITLQSSTNISCNGILGCANLNITGGSGIYNSFQLQYLDPSSQSLVAIIPANNNYYNICNLKAGTYYLTVTDSKKCTTAPYLFKIYDFSSLSIDSITMDASLCADTPGKIRIKVKSLDTNLSFFYNNVLVPSTSLSNGMYELSIETPSVPTGIVKVQNGQNCWISATVSTAIISPDFEFTSSNFKNFGSYSVNGSVQFTNLLVANSIPKEWSYVEWDFGDNTPFKAFYNPADVAPNSNGDNLETVFHTFTTNGIYPVTLTAYNSSGCSRKVTKNIVVGSGATMMLPTIFTPNNDGMNDVFRPSLMGIKDVTMYIYDNWGNLVYDVSSSVLLLSENWGWNGIEKGKTVPTNNEYRYYIIATALNDKTIEKEGKFLLIQ